MFTLVYYTIIATFTKDFTKGFLNPRLVKQAIRLVDNVYTYEVRGNFDYDIGNVVLNRRD